MTEETRTIVVREMDAMELPDVDALKQGLATVRKFQEVVRTLMIEGHDYGTIPGTPKPTLLKPGAEKIAKILGLADTYEIVSETEDWQKPFFAYKVRCYLRRFGSESVVSTGLGECNSMETKYRWRWVWPDAVPDAQKGGLVFRTVKGGGKQYRLENDQIYDQVNTILKMAKKRALVDAALSAGRLSDVFTQDIEDFAGRIQSEAEAKTAQDAPTGAKPPGAAQTTAQGDKALVEGRGNCPVHGVAFVHKTGIAKTGQNVGKAFDFWACPAPKDAAGNYCKEQPQTAALLGQESLPLQGPPKDPADPDGLFDKSGTPASPTEIRQSLKDAIMELARKLGRKDFAPNWSTMTPAGAAALHTELANEARKA